MSTTAASAPAFGDRPVLSEVAAALAVLQRAEVSRLWALSGPEVEAVLGALERVRATAEAQQVAVMAEAGARGLGAEAGCSPVDWATAAAPGMSTGHAATLQAVAAACQDPRLAALAEAVGAGTLTLPKAAALARFHAGAAPVADPAQLAADTAILIEAAPRLGERQLAVAIRHATALLRPEREAEHLEERRRAARALHKGPGPAGMATYRLVLDPEGAAILDAAIDPLARPNPAAGAPDLRTPAARRAEALLTVIGRGVSSPGQAPKTAKTTLVVTLSLETLTGQLLGTPGGVGTAGAPTRCRTCGTTPTGPTDLFGDARPSGAALTLGQELLTPATVRRLACEADLIPAVLGTDSEVLDLGRTRRLVPPALRLAAWLRDAGCTWPGCTVPAQWCDAHHATPWWRGGRTSLANTALLCGRHHTLAHERDLTPTITDTTVTWHL